MEHICIIFLGCPTVIDETPASSSSSIIENNQDINGTEMTEPGGNVSEDISLKYHRHLKTLEEYKGVDVLKQTAEKYCDSPKSVHDTSNLSTCSDWFNTTRDEMILYEKFGEDYDIIVEKMNKEEKIKLKEEVSKATPKDVTELLGTNEIISDSQGIMQLTSSKDTSIKVSIIRFDSKYNPGKF